MSKKEKKGKKARQATLALAEGGGLEISHSPPRKDALSESPSSRRAGPIRTAFPTPRDPDTLQEVGEEVASGSEEEPEPRLLPDRRDVVGANGSESGDSTSETEAASSDASEQPKSQKRRTQGKRSERRSTEQRAPPSSSRSKRVVESEEEEDEEHEGKSGSGSEVEISEGDSDDAHPPRSRTRHLRNHFLVDDEAEEATDSDNDDNQFIPRVTKKPKGRVRVAPASSDGESSEPVVAKAPVASSGARKNKLQNLASRSRTKRKASSPIILYDSSDDLETLDRRAKKPLSKRIKRSPKAFIKSQGRVSSQSSSDGDDVFIVPDDEEEEPLGSPSENDSDVARAAKASKLSKSSRRSKRPKRDRKGKGRAVEQSDDDDEDDLELSGKETVLSSRLRATTQSSQARHSSPAKPKARYLGAEDDESEDSDPLQEDLDEDLADFLVTDDEDQAAEVAQFRETTSMKAQGAAYYIKTYLQWLVHLIICPEVDWLESEASFKAAHRYVNRDLLGLVNSLVSSSAWRENFRRAVDQRPEFDLESLPDEDQGVPCDACSMGNYRHSKYMSTLGGKKYNTTNFAELDDSSDDSSDSGSDSNAGTTRRRFNLGEFCAGRAQVYSELKHWPWTAHQRLVEEVGRVRKPAPKAQPHDGSKKGRRKERKRVEDLLAAEADRVAAELDERGVISGLAREYEDSCDQAKKGFTTR